MVPAPPGAGRLLVCPTPIGNLDDITLRVLAALAAADVIACEDTRHTRTLLDRHGLAAVLTSFHEHNERARTRELVARIRAGAVVALVSDSGAPLISDPGYELVRACLQAGLQVEVLPGPSAVTTAVIASALATDRWLFVGFLPRKRSELGALLADGGHALVAFESPRRLAATLALLASYEPQRATVVCRELSKLHEEVRRGSAAELALHYGQHPARGEVVLVLAPAEPRALERTRALKALRELTDAGARPRRAAAVVAALSGLRANELYAELTGGEQ